MIVLRDLHALIVARVDHVEGLVVRNSSLPSLVVVADAHAAEVDVTPLHRLERNLLWTFLYLRC